MNGEWKCACVCVACVDDGGVRMCVDGNHEITGVDTKYVSWTDDSAIPVRHEDIVIVLEAIGTQSFADALLSFRVPRADGSCVELTKRRLKTFAE